MVGADNRADSMIHCMNAVALHGEDKERWLRWKQGGKEEKNFDPCGDQLGARCISSFNPPKAQETWA